MQPLQDCHIFVHDTIRVFFPVRNSIIFVCNEKLVRQKTVNHGTAVLGDSDAWLKFFTLADLFTVHYSIHLTYEQMILMLYFFA
jgi:hypothetical protein